MLQADSASFHLGDRRVSTEATIKSDKHERVECTDNSVEGGGEHIVQAEKLAAAQGSTALHSAPQSEPALASGPEVKTDVRPAGSGTGKKVSSQRLHCSAGYLQRGLPVTGKAFWVPQTACSPCLSRLHRSQTALKKSPSPATRQSPSCRQAFRSTEDDAPVKHQDLKESVAQGTRSGLYTGVSGVYYVQPDAAIAVRKVKGFLLFLEWITLRSVTRLCWDPGIDTNTKARSEEQTMRALLS